MFAELLARSCFSFLRGASRPEELVCTAQALGLEALALCDRDGLYGSVRAFSQAREVGQRIIVGAELTLEVGQNAARPVRSSAPAASQRPSGPANQSAGATGRRRCEPTNVAWSDCRKS